MRRKTQHRNVLACLLVSAIIAIAAFAYLLITPTTFSQFSVIPPQECFTENNYLICNKTYGTTCTNFLGSNQAYLGMQYNFNGHIPDIIKAEQTIKSTNIPSVIQTVTLSPIGGKYTLQQGYYIYSGAASTNLWTNQKFAGDPGCVAGQPGYFDGNIGFVVEQRFEVCQEPEKLSWVGGNIGYICVPPTKICQLGTYECDGIVQKTCANEYEWTVVQPCQYGCENGECKVQPTPSPSQGQGFPAGGIVSAVDYQQYIPYVLILIVVASTIIVFLIKRGTRKWELQ